MFAISSLRRLAPVICIIGLALAACGDDSSTAATTAGPVTSAAAATTTATGGPDPSAAAAYCTDKGGKLVTRIATWNTNGDESQYLPLATTMDFCEFESTDNTGNTTRISVDLTTLYS